MTNPQNKTHSAGRVSKTCQNCKCEFTIESEDFKFYEKFGVQVPGFCHECRLQRKLTWRNERSLYKRNCGLCGKTVISVFSSDKPFPVYCHDCYRGHSWDPLSYGEEVDFSKHFLDQFFELQQKVPRQYALVFGNINSEYTNGTGYNKNCYLIFVSDHNEDCFYSFNIYYCRNSLDLSTCFNCEYCYELLNCSDCNHCSFSIDCRDSYNLLFSKDCVNCHDLVGCVGLRNKAYAIFNVVYSKEEYEKRISDLDLSSYHSTMAIKSKAQDLFRKYPVKYLHGSNNKDVTGDMVNNSKNTLHAFSAKSLEDSKYIINGNKARESYECYVAVDDSEYCFDSLGCANTQNVKASHLPWDSFDCDYTDACESSNNCFGCVGLLHHEYCILNKRYSKEEYVKLREKIIAGMKEKPYTDKEGRTYNFGEFFPAEFSPHDYNETLANFYYPLSKEEAKKHGYFWKDPEPKDYTITLDSDNLPNNIKNVDDSILKEVIVCEHKGSCITDQCTEAFRITPGELVLYRRLNIPLPRLCHNCRYYERLKLENPKKLWKRQCQCAGSHSENGLYKNTGTHEHKGEKCQTEFETSYAPDRKEIVYCEKCYQKEVY
ncbi:MAG TPA: hypothetical protein PKZ36_01985 [Candidatus Paceibacterota bacterium]|nr:hypothetical protein [Candidatus Paceibacterota bacterium]HPT18157.1 hypothetical protein [Candidatus Paceibacterota bacterium]